MINNLCNNYIFSFIGSGISSMLLLNEFVKHKKILNESTFHIFEKNVFPFGLVRTGFAPDNYKVKENLIELFTNILKKNKNINYYGNIFISNEILRNISPYNSMVFVGDGFQEKKLLNITNENYMIDSIDMVNWYNGEIMKEDNNIQNIIVKNKLDNLIIIGNGNVSLDIIRILFLTNENLLYKYGIPEKRIKYIKHLRNKINSIYIIGRNSINKPAFTKSEFKKFLEYCQKYGNINIYLNDIELINKDNFYFNKKINLMLNNMNDSNKNKKQIIFLFNNVPLSYDKKYLYIQNKVRKNKIKSNIIIKCIGRNRKNIVGLKNVIQLPSYKNINEGFISSKNLYEQIINKINDNSIKKNNTKDFNSKIKNILEGKRIIYKNDWYKINEFEKDEGKKTGKIRTKITDIQKVFNLL